MTKERRLAILMWEEVARQLESSPDKYVDAIKIKRDFCSKHGLKWKCDCWFCEYIKECSKCPLSFKDEDGLAFGCSDDDGLYTQVLFGDSRELYEAAKQRNLELSETLGKLQAAEIVRSEERKNADKKIADARSGSARERFDRIVGGMRERGAN